MGEYNIINNTGFSVLHLAKYYKIRRFCDKIERTIVRSIFVLFEGHILWEFLLEL